MTSYRLHTERHFLPATTSGPYYVPSRDFFFAIRRSGGSLVFRTETLRLANEILDRLNGGERS